MKLKPSSVAALEKVKKVSAKRRVVFVYGNFNIVHPGHLRLLRFASECGDYLVVGVRSDRTSTDLLIGEEARLESIAAISWVNHAFILDDAAVDFIAALRPAVVVKGKEHEALGNPELSILKSYGGQLMFGSGDVTFSSLELIRSESERVNHAAITRSAGYLGRHNIDIGDLTHTLDQMKQLKVCVIGDTIVDEYIQCDPLGMSQEDPTIVVTPLVTDRFVGGAAIVAAHARSLGAKSVDFFSVIGNDKIGTYIDEKLRGYKVRTQLVVDESRPTTLKQRYRVGSKTLLRVSHLRQHGISTALQRQMLDRIMAKIADSALVVFADFNYGVLTQELVDAIAKECQQRKITMVADSQSSSQIGDVSRFKNTALITPTEREARLAMSNHDDGLVVLADRLRQKAKASHVVVTLGAEGILVHTRPTRRHRFHTDQLEALNTSPKDPAGAGDCLLVCTAMGLVLGRPIWESAYLGSLAAACQVGRIGNLPLTADELRIEIGKSRPREG